MSLVPVRSFLALVLCGLTLLSPRADAAYEVVRGSFNLEDRVVVAGNEGALLKYTSGLTLELSPGAKLRQHKDTDLWMASAGKTPTELFTLVSGRVHAVRLARAGKRDIAVLVTTSRKLMGATADGEFVAIADKDEGVVAALRGTTLLSTGTAWQALTEGQYGKVTRGMPKIVTLDLPQAPVLRTSKKLWMSLSENATIEGLSWTRGGADVSVRLSVTRSDSGEEVSSFTLSSDSLPHNRLTLGPGLYLARVQSTNSYGLSGPYSEPVQLRVIGVKTHRGARVDARGTVHLAANQRAEFMNVEGLLMAYGNGSQWAPATASVPLRDHEPVFVHFREHDSADVVSARLEPRGVVADVYVGSKLAQWPGDTVEVRVHLQDGAGDLADGAVVPKFEVTLGIEPLAVKWKRDGATWRAQIPPQPGPGPWVIRAVVTDEHGVELGRDFLEIAERADSNKRTAASSRAKVHVANRD